MSNLTDNAIIQIFLPVINAGLIADGFTGVKVKQANQPTMQGINTDPTAYFFKVASKRYGFLGRNDAWDSLTSQMKHTENQFIEATWQIQCLYLQDPATPNQYTASDLAFEISSIMQSDNTRTILNNSDVGILRVTDISNQYFTDDRDNFEAIPSFDFTLVYGNSRVTIDPSYDTYKIKTYPI